MDENAKWVLGLIFTVIIAAAGYIRHVAAMIKNGDDVLHDRINRTRDEYVKRSDLDAHLLRVEKQVDELKESIKESRRDANERLDKISAKLDRGH